MMTVDVEDAVTAITLGTCRTPTARHSPGDQRFESFASSGGKGLVIGRMVVTHHVEAEAVGIATIVSATRKAAHGSNTAFKHIAARAGQEVISDIAPALHVHVIVLNTAD